MFKFIDGTPTVLTFRQVESMYYRAFVTRFPDAGVSLAQWRGSYEYQAIYPEIQMMIENGVIMNDSLNQVMQVIREENQRIYRPAALQTRVSERFAQAGYEATIRMATLETKGIVAICVDQERQQAPREMTIGVNQTNPASCGYYKTVMGELYPAGYISADGVTTEIIGLNTGSSDTDPATYMKFDKNLDGVTPIVLTFSGAITGTFTFNPTVTYLTDYSCSDVALSTALRANEGGLCQIVITGDTSSTIPTRSDDAVIGDLIRDEILPAGQFMEGDIVYDTALSNGQAVAIRWTTPKDHTNQYRVTITKLRNTQHAVDNDQEIINRFMANFNSMMGIGLDITPERYLTTEDLPWAAAVLVEYEPLEGDGVTGSGEWHSDIVPVEYNVRFNAELREENIIIQ